VDLRSERRGEIGLEAADLHPLKRTSFSVRPKNDKVKANCYQSLKLLVAVGRHVLEILTEAGNDARAVEFELEAGLLGLQLLELLLSLRNGSVVALPRLLCVLLHLIQLSQFLNKKYDDTELELMTVERAAGEGPC